MHSKLACDLQRVASVLHLSRAHTLTLHKAITAGSGGAGRGQAGTWVQNLQREVMKEGLDWAGVAGHDSCKQRQQGRPPCGE